MAAIVSKANGQIFCGATIIDTNYALTAAHCINSQGRYASDIELLVGEHDYRNRWLFYQYRIIRTINTLEWFNF